MLLSALDLARRKSLRKAGCIESWQQSQRLHVIQHTTVLIMSMSSAHLASYHCQVTVVLLANSAVGTIPSSDVEIAGVA